MRKALRSGAIPIILIFLLFTAGACALPGTVSKPAATMVFEPKDPEGLTSEQMQKTADVLSRRYKGLSGWARVNVEGQAIRVELQKNQDVSLAKMMATEPGKVIFFQGDDSTRVGNPVPETISPVFDGSSIASASVTKLQAGGYAVAFSMTQQGTQVMADYTSSHIGSYLCIARDAIVISCPKISTAILNGQGLIQGNFTLESANSLAMQLRFGSLPVQLILSTK